MSAPNENVDQEKENITWNKAEILELKNTTSLKNERKSMKTAYGT